MLGLIVLVASASALDVWGGSNNAVRSGSGTITGTQGLLFTDTAAGILSANLQANAQIDGTTPGVGLAYSDWSTPLTTITRTKVVGTTTHDLTIVFGGHVQAGIEKTSNLGAGTAQASISASATPTDTVAGDTGVAAIRSQLQMNGKSSGYAIADGTAAYASSEKVGSTSNDLYKVTGSAIGKVDIRGETNAAGDTGNLYTLSKMAAGADIYTSSSAAIAAGTGSSYSRVTTDPNAVSQDGKANTTIAVTNGQATSSAWDGSSSTSKTADNANALTSVTTPISVTMTTWNEDTAPSLGHDNDHAEIDQAGIIATASVGHASSTVASSAEVERVAATSTKKATAEAFVRGGTWNAVARVNEFNLLQATGALGGTWDGIASGAHLVNPSGTPTARNDIDSGLILAQNAYTATTGTRTSAQLTKAGGLHAVDGPQFTGNVLDDAGSYFSTTGYTTTSTMNPGIPITYQTNVGASSDIKWLQGLDPSSNIYTQGFGVTSTGLYSSNLVTTYNLAPTGLLPRTEDINFQFTQP
jgi:hypothetical protein